MAHKFKLPATYPDKSKPLWIELIFSNSQLLRLCLSEFKMAEKKPNFIKDIVKLEKEYPKIKKQNYPQTFVNYHIVNLWMIEKFLEKFERENFISSNTIKQLRIKVLKIKKRTKELIATESLIGVLDVI